MVITLKNKKTVRGWFVSEDDTQLRIFNIALGRIQEINRSEISALVFERLG